MAAGPGFDVMAHLPALQVMVPLLGSVACAMVRERHVCAALTIACSVAMPVIAFAILWQVQATGTISYAMGGWAPPIGIEYRIDLINAFLLVLVSIMGAVVALYAPRSVANEIAPEKQGWYFSMYLMCLAGLLGMAITGDAFNIFVFMEISSLAMYTLIALGSERRALVAAFQYLIIGTIGATFYVIGVGMVFTVTGTLNLFDLAQRLPEIENLRSVLAGLAFITVGFGLKLAMFPMHLWLPNAYAFAPTVATAFIASTATKVAIYLLLRFLFSVFGLEYLIDHTPGGEVFMVLAGLAMVVCSVAAVFQINIKRMLAYSSVAQVGYMLAGIAVATELGLTGTISHMFNHALIKACLFLAVGCMFYSAGIRRIEHMAGIGRTMPLTMMAFVIAGLGLIGVPGTAGFVSKWYLVQAAADVDNWLLIALIMISSVLAVVYIGRIVEIAWFHEPEMEVVRKPPLEMQLVVWALVVATVYFGIQTDISAGVPAEAASELMKGWALSGGTQ